MSNRNNRSIRNKTILSFLLGGLIYAGLAAGDDYRSGEAFSIVSFSLKFIFFGGFMAVLNNYMMKSKQKEEKNADS